MGDGISEERNEFLTIAEGYLERRLEREALRLAELWLKRFPFDAEAQIIHCRALLKMGKLDEVNAILAGVENTIGELSRIYHCVGDICREAGLTGEAIKFYRKFIVLNQGTPAAQEVEEKLHSLEGVPPRAGELRDEDTYDDLSGIAPDFHTLTLAELYIKQGHLDLAAGVLSEILKRDAGNQSAAERLIHVKALMEEKTQVGAGAREKRNEEVIEELTRWLANLGRMRIHAA